MLKIAFASADRVHVDLHFGGAESLVLFDVAPGRADLIGFTEFAKAEQAGSESRAGLTGTVKDKVIPKLDFVKECAAVYAVSIGANSIRRLMALGVQPIIVEPGHEILDLLNEVSLALVYGGLPWVEHAKAKAQQAPQRAAAGPSGTCAQVAQSAVALTTSHRLIADASELE
jgi:nitrogen fixation protein NifX